MGDMVKSEDRAREMEKHKLPTEVVDQDDLTPEDMQIPRAKLAQGTTREVKEGTAQIGHFINSISGQDYGDSIEFIASTLLKQRFKFTSDGMFDCVSFDLVTGSKHGSCGDCNYKEFQTENGEKKERGPECGTVFAYLGIIVKGEDFIDGPLVFGISGTSTPIAKRLNTIFKMAKCNRWERRISFSSVLKEDGNNSWQKLTMEVLGQPSPDLMKLAFDAYKFSQGKNIIVSEENDKPDDSADDGDSPF